MSMTSGDRGLEGFGLSTDQADEVRMAVVEACINVVTPMEGAGREAEVVLEAMGPEDAPEGLRITVRAAGAGFPGGHPLPGTGESSADARKWRHSLKIIRALMDAVEVRSDRESTAVIMRKLL